MDADAIRLAVLSKGWTLAEWAARAGVSEVTAVALLKGRPVRPGTLMALLGTAGLDAKDVLRLHPDADAATDRAEGNDAA